MREYQLIKKAIHTFRLDLTDLVIFTEAASGNFKWTPIIACMAGAKKVYAIAKDSKFGNADNVGQEIYDAATTLKTENNLEIIKQKNEEYISRADIFTNLGFVRPIDRNMIATMKKTAVISLMWEPWEFRDEDIDKQACKEFNVPIIGVDERHKDLQIFTYVGLTVAKLLFENNIEIFKSTVLLVGSGILLDATLKILKNLKAHVLVIDTQKNDAQRIKKLNNTIDAIVLIEHTRRDAVLIGEKGILNEENTRVLNNDAKIIHMCGKIDREFVKKKFPSLIPDDIAPRGHMSFTADYVGPKPLIYLHAAGLKAGESGVRLRMKGINVAKLKKYSSIGKVLAL